MQFSTGLLALAALLANPVFGHMVMKSPVPYGKSTLQNGPLLADGSDFPCKQRPGVYDLEGADNVLEIGQSNPLEFTGGATHNGGSCQVSLTTDLQPTKNSKWMVIKSIEGGCPAPVLPQGNCGDSASDTCASKFEYTIPEGIQPGKYTIAWSWINHTGNREFYMNCGPATVVGAKKKRYNPNPVVRRQTQFPDLFVANIPSINDCTTPPNADYAYPNPGEVVQLAGQASALTTLTCGAGGNNAAQQPTAADSAPASSAVITSAAASAPTGAGSAPAASPAVFATVSVSAANVQPGDPSPATSAAAPAATGSTSGSTSGSSGLCTVGDWNCLDGKSYQRCFGAGTWSPTMPLAAGMSCTPGISANIDMAPGKAKRVVRVADGLFDGYAN